jgi:cold shock CspA family protein
MVLHFYKFRQKGTVREFDVHRGLGIIESADGELFPFHCIVISDGTRTIEPGREVYFSPYPALGGRIEAVAVDKA